MAGSTCASFFFQQRSKFFCLSPMEMFEQMTHEEGSRCACLRQSRRGGKRSTELGTAALRTRGNHVWKVGDLRDSKHRRAHAEPTYHLSPVDHQAFVLAQRVEAPEVSSSAPVFFPCFQRTKQAAARKLTTALRPQLLQVGSGHTSPVDKELAPAFDTISPRNLHRRTSRARTPELCLTATL